jgi:hypothetical protein
MCPVAEQACRDVVNLPMYPRAGLATARRSVRFIAQVGLPATLGRAWRSVPTPATLPVGPLGLPRRP